jgi:rhodanese-related sulfurtransferase
MEHLTPKETARFLHDNPQALLIDCRSEREFRFVGHPVGAIHLPWNDEAGRGINPHFADQLKTLTGDRYDLPVALICRTGDRSVEAGKAIEAAGFSRVCSVLKGFEGDVDATGQRGKVNGWRGDGLPWETSVCTKCGS